MATAGLSSEPVSEPKRALGGALKNPFVGNVSKLVPLPSERRGGVRKGRLQFDACFEGGNLGRVDYISDYEYDLFIRPDTCNPRFRVWFNFTVCNVRSEQRVIFNIVNFNKTKSLYRDGMSPLVKSTSRPKWQRIPSKSVFYYRCPDHGNNYVLSYAFAFDREEDTYHFAYCYPYSYSRLQQYLDGVDGMNLPFWRRELLCQSVQQRRLDMVTISSPDNLQPHSHQRMVFITARVHPGETPSSYVCQGIMDYLLSSDPGAKVLRDHIVFKIVPMLNPDGVFLGNYRCSLMGFDLNRHWTDPSPWAHPTLHATKELVMQCDRDTNVDIDFYIDVHAHSTLTNGFMYGNVYDEEERFERQAVFPRLLSTHAEDFSMRKTSFNRDSVKAGTGRRFLGGCLDPRTHCYTLEVSFFSYTTTDSHTQAPYTEEACITTHTPTSTHTHSSSLSLSHCKRRYHCFVSLSFLHSKPDLELGRNVARTFLAYYKLTHLLSGTTASSSTSPTVHNTSISAAACSETPPTNH